MFVKKISHTFSTNLSNFGFNTLRTLFIIGVLIFAYKQHLDFLFPYSFRSHGLPASTCGEFLFHDCFCQFQLFSVSCQKLKVSLQFTYTQMVSYLTLNIPTKNRILNIQIY